ncbi:MAG: hypothetical protein EOO43_23555 [Flavobacterium sp.]|nr:MAG: hypothetical protein EOO43_23555 [Flavobacterium sp.]
MFGTRLLLHYVVFVLGCRSSDPRIVIRRSVVCSVGNFGSIPYQVYPVRTLHKDSLYLPLELSSDFDHWHKIFISENETKVKFTYESSHIEIPLEVYYIIKNKKIGIAGSAGMSLLFEGKNSVFAESENVRKLKIGKLETTLETNFTGNAKLYLFYKITPSLQLDLYPTFQYQIMGRTDSFVNSGYYFSVRTGFSYKL